MRQLSAAATLVLGALLALAVFAIAARFADGPIGPFVGGAFRSGEYVTDDSVAWHELAELRHAELQLVAPPTSRTTNFIVHDGHAYIPCGVVKLGPYTTTGQAAWKRWHRDVERDPRVILRIDGGLYERRAVKVEDPALHRTLVELLARKYDMNLAEPPDLETAWFYRLEARIR